MEWMLEQLNTMGSGFAGFAGLMLIESAVLIGLILLLESVLRKKVRAALRYWLVTLVLVFLALTPILPMCPPSRCLSVHNTAHADPTTHQAVGQAEAPLPQPPTVQLQTTLVGVGETPSTLSWQAGVFLLWLAGVAVMTVVVVRRAARACKCVECSPGANFLMTDILLYCRKRMGIKGKVRLKICADGMRPAVCGPFRPVIIVPANLVPTLGSRHLRDVLFHELAHLKRHDMWVNIIQNVVLVLYFYNPFLWVASAVIRRLRDEAADEVVIETVGQGDRSYAQRLIDVARLTIRRPASNLSLIGVP